MSRLLRATCVMFLVVSACGRSERSDAPAPGAGDSRAAALAPVGRAADGSDSDCPMDTTFRHDNPVALVEEFVRRDAEGPFEREDLARAWEGGALSCVERNTSDHYEVITAFRIESLGREQGVATVGVRRMRAFEVGWDSAGRVPRLVPARRDWTDTIVVVRTRYGWRIDRLHAGAHRLPGRALGELRNLSSADRAELKRLGARPGA